MTVCQKLGVILKSKVVQKLSFEKIRLIFDIQNWLWKYDFGTFWQTVITRRIFLKIFPWWHVDSWPKSLLLRTQHLWNSTTELILDCLIEMVFIECHIWVAMCQLICSSAPVKYKRKGLLLNQICIEQNRARQRGARLVIQQNHFVKPTLSTTKFF